MGIDPDRTLSVGHIAITATFHLYLFIFFYEAGDSHVKCNMHPLQTTPFNLQVPLIQGS